MKTREALTITLPPDLAEIVESKVRSGEYASEAEVIQDGIRSLVAGSRALDEWIAGDVIPALDALVANASRVVSSVEAWREIMAHMDRAPVRDPSAP
jgi:antitoxin ParD1/3/4